MKKKIIFALVAFMALLPCVSASATENGQFYLEPFIGGTISPNRGLDVGLSAGYTYCYGLGFDATVSYRHLSGYNLLQAGGGIKYECPYLHMGYPIIGAGVGVMIDFPQSNYGYATVDPVISYKCGYAFRVVPDYLDIGAEYRGDAIFMLNQANGYLWGTIVEHSLVVTMRVYLTH